MKKFTEEQLRVIESSANHLAVIAGAGTGKTTVLTEKIKYLINEGVNPFKILAITFTRKAAKEMSQRIKNDLVKVSTFDAYCYNLVKDEFKINIIEDNIPFYQKEVLSFHLYDANLKKGKQPSGYQRYIDFKNKYNLKDFNDLAYLAMNRLSNHNYEYILVDEFQDTNPLQLKVLSKLIKVNVKSIIVGDPDQSIYGFRGAKKQVFDMYIKYYQAKVIRLTYNFRSNKKIINSANNLISHNKERIKKTLVGKSDFKGAIYYYDFISKEDEANFIINEAKNYFGKSVAVLYRNHSMAYNLRLSLNDVMHHINLLSIHEAKGLEFDVVFLIGLDKGLFPNKKIKQVRVLEEERRLMFVAVTRAKKYLYLLSSSKPSLFIREMVK